MAAFTETSDASGRDVVRCYVKGAAPAVMSHAASALSAGTSIPWDEDLRSRGAGQRPADGGGRAAGDGRGFRDLDPAVVRPRRRPAGLRRRPRDHEPRRDGRPAARGVKAGGGRRPEGPHPRAHGHRRRRDHRRRDRQAAGDRGRGDPRRRVRRTRRDPSGSRGSTGSASSAASLPSTRCCSSTRSSRRATWSR